MGGVRDFYKKKKIKICSFFSDYTALTTTAYNDHCHDHSGSFYQKLWAINKKEFWIIQTKQIIQQRKKGERKISG